MKVNSLRMMSENDDNVNSRLAFGFSNQRVFTEIEDNSGAGVNAGSRVDMAFAASDPLSELVWSPHKGLSLKCTDCSLVEKKPSFLWDAGPSTLVLSPSDSSKSRRANDDKHIDEANLIMSQVALHQDNDLSNSARGKSNSAGPLFGSNCEEHTGTVNKPEEVSPTKKPFVQLKKKEEYSGESLDEVSCSSNVIQNAGLDEISGKNAGQDNQREFNSLPLQNIETGLGMAMAEPFSEKFAGKIMIDHIGGTEVEVDKRILGLEVASTSDIHIAEQQEARDDLMQNLACLCGRGNEIVTVLEGEVKGNVKMDVPNSDNPLEKMEFTAENDLQHLVSDNACRQMGKRHVEDEYVPPIVSPTNSKMLLYLKKGKERASSDGEADETTSKDDDSHDSMESCNSAGLISKGKRKWSFEQQLIVGSKQIKKQLQETPTVTSMIRENSSFMNWISNIVKGLPKLDQDEENSLALAHASDGNENHDQRIITCSKKMDSGSKYMGFHSLFQSLYCSNTKIHETEMSNVDFPQGGSNQLLTDGACSAKVTPVGCHVQLDESCQKFIPSNEFSTSTIRNGKRTLTECWDLSANIAANQETGETNSAENETSINPSLHGAKDGVNSSDSSLGKPKTGCAKNHSEPLYESNVIQDVVLERNPLESSWIARFSPKTANPLFNSDHCNQSTNAALGCLADMERPRLALNSVEFSVEQKSSQAKERSYEQVANVGGKELLSHDPRPEAFKTVNGQNHQKPIYKFSATLHSQKAKSSEAMSSMFARRLDALKHIPSDVKDASTSRTLICFFCGGNGHDLLDCLQIKKTELEYYLRNLSSYQGTEESSLLCIRCFRHDHWAITCPKSFSSGQWQAENVASLVDHQKANELQLCSGNESYPNMLKTMERCDQVSGRRIICDRDQRYMDANHCLKPISNRKLISAESILSSNDDKKQTGSGSRENEQKANQIIPFCNLIIKQISDVPREVFDAIRGLRLSRVDIFKASNSHIPLSHLDGFFLRLRLGKWEKGLGGTGYHVACISGAHRGKSLKLIRNHISVKVGSIKCSVESRYISNNDFVEEELKAWWSTTAKSGGMIPSVDELKLKLEERKLLRL